jgi:FtsP/CotA-like multicopper oxidase with cupredoxin domain
MHLHGFYYRVDSRGDGMVDTTYRVGAGDRVVTEGSGGGTTFTMSWVPERAGNWLFHCHIPEHFARRGPLGMPLTAPPAMAMHDGMNHALDAMGGLVLGITVRPSPTTAAVAVAAPRESERRHLRLLVRRNAGGTDSLPYFGFAIQDGAVVPPRDSGLHVGPPLVLVRGQPTSITVVNTLDEPTAVHWHGIELESYFDGVAGFSGDGSRTSPVIAPRDSFEARMTPPRAGTFIYHTHVDEERQELAGLAGPLIVLEPGVRYDAATDRAILFTSPLAFDDQRTAVLIDGSLTPPPLVLRAGTTYRLRFVNMTLRRPTLRIELLRDTTLLRWRPLAKDGADLPTDRRVVGPALHARGISIGETYDVEVTPDRPGELQLAVSIGGRLPVHPRMATLPVHVVP